MHSRAIAHPAHAHSLPAYVVVGAYIIGYVLLDWVSYVYPVAPYAITPWNPQAGLSLALLLGFGLRYAPALLVAAISAEFFVRGGASTSVIEIGVYACVLATGYTAIAAVLVRNFRFDPRFLSLRDVLVFTAIAAAGAIVIAVVYITAHVLAGRFSWEDFPGLVLQFWVGDLIGVLVTTPFVLVHIPRLLKGHGRLRAEPVLQALAIAITLAVVFSMPDDASAKFFYLLFLPLIWVCMRHGFEGATAALLGTQLGLILAAHIAGYTAASVRELQTLMLTLAVTGTFLGMAVTQWRRASRALEAREADLSRAMRAAAAAEMASALAHELNQPLTAASNYVQACDIIVREKGPQDVLQATVGKARAEVERASEVVRRLRDFYRGGDGRREKVHVSEVLRAALQPLRPRLERHRIGLREALPPELPGVSVDRVQMELVLHNLLANAIDSIASAEGGEREIVVEAMSDGGTVKISVEDSGPGMSPQIGAQLFQSFSTSKRGGMGLGLAISRSIVESHGGRLWHDPRVARGARFILTLPVAR